jgi:bacteriocin biosynthesis cyclodehydratase domain-containing protein
MARDEKSSDDRFQPLTLNPYLKIIHTSDDEIVVKHGSRSRFTRIIKDDGRSKLLGKLLRNMVPPSTLESLRQRNILKEEELDDATELARYLRREEVLVDPAKDLTRVYLDSILGGGNAFSGLTVGVVGVGYLGSRIADELMRLGIGRLIVLDDRRVARGDIDKLYFNLLPQTIETGELYVDCLRRHLAQCGFEKIEAVNAPLDDEVRLREVIGASDLTVAALEVFSSKVLHTINGVAIDAERPWVSIYFDGSEGRVGPLYVPGETCCYNEYEIQHEATLSGMKDDYLLYKEALNEGKIDGSNLVMPPYLNMVSSLGTTGVMRFLLSGRSFLVGRYTRLDLERLSIDYEEVLRLPRCPACSPHRAAHRHLFM